MHTCKFENSRRHPNSDLSYQKKISYIYIYSYIYVYSYIYTYVYSKIYTHIWGELYFNLGKLFFNLKAFWRLLFIYLHIESSKYIYCSIIWCTHKHTKTIIQRVPLSLPPDSRYNKLPNAATEICKGRFCVRSMSTKTPLFCQATCLHGSERKGYPRKIIIPVGSCLSGEFLSQNNDPKNN